MARLISTTQYNKVGLPSSNVIALCVKRVINSIPYLYQYPTIPIPQATAKITALSSSTFTASDASITTGSKVVFASLGTATGLTLGLEYFVIGYSANTWQVSATFGGSAVTVTYTSGALPTYFVTGYYLNYTQVSYQGINGFMNMIVEKAFDSTWIGTTLGDYTTRNLVLPVVNTNGSKADQSFNTDGIISVSPLGTQGTINILGQAASDKIYSTASAKTITAIAGTALTPTAIDTTAETLTLTASNLKVDQSVMCAVTGNGFTAGVLYYVIAAGLTADVFSLSTTPGGSAVNVTGSLTTLSFFYEANGTAFTPTTLAHLTGVFTKASHGLTTGNTLYVADAGTPTGTGWALDALLYVTVITSSTFTVSATSSGSAITFDTDTLGSANFFTGATLTKTVGFTSVAHGYSNGDYLYPATVGSVTGLTLGTPVYVVNKSADFFQVSATSGGVPITISGTIGAGVTTNKILATTYDVADSVEIVTITGGSGLSAATTYYVSATDGYYFQLSATIGGSAVNFSTNITAGTVATGQSTLIYQENLNPTVYTIDLPFADIVILANV